MVGGGQSQRPQGSLGTFCPFEMRSFLSCLQGQRHINRKVLSRNNLPIGHKIHKKQFFWSNLGTLSLV